MIHEIKNKPVKCKFHTLEEKNKCKFCAKWRQTYSRFKKLGRSNIRLYCIKLVHYRTHEWFWKIGITSQTIEDRFDETMERFYLQTEWEVILPLYDAVTEETSMLYDIQIVQNRKYAPIAKFSGHTECFR